MTMERIFFWLFTLVFPMVTFGQVEMEDKSESSRGYVPASPVATMFNIFGKIPVSHFTGTPDISIPLHVVNYKDLNISLDLKYHHAIGAKPEAIPGYYGNGWLLTTGGVITRLSKGVRTFEVAEEYPVQVDDPRASADWKSNETMQEYLEEATIFDDAGGRYDEYSFEFLGYSGKFYTDHEGKKRVKTKTGEELLIEAEVPLYVIGFNVPEEPQSERTQFGLATYNPLIPQNQFIYKFTITDSRGIRYIFGGSNNSIDFVRRSMGWQEYDVPNANTLPSTWHLTAIESPNGYKIEYEYQRGPFYITSQEYLRGKIFSHSNIPNTWTGEQPIKRIKSTLYNPCYLKKIKTPVSYTEFYWSIADQQLRYFYSPYNPPFDPNFDWVALHPDYDNPAYFCHYPDVNDAFMENRFANKLDSFTVYNLQNKAYKRVHLNYTTDTTTRLKLQSVHINGASAASDKALVYEFLYNSMPLPPYRSFNTDKFGFYNGEHHYMDSLGPDYYLSLFNNTSSREQYLLSREPDPTYTKAEVLEKVIYPTGGYTFYEYENNKYGSYASYWPNTISENSGGSILLAGGLRIRSISHYDGFGKMTGKKTYYYCKNFPDTASSSGVLSYQPEFYRHFLGSTGSPANAPGYGGDILFIQFGADPINPLSYNKGSIITYSEVAEVDENGGFSAFTFKNYDNGFHDKPAENLVCDNSNIAPFWKEDDTNLMDMERGQLLSERVYNNNLQLIKRVEYKYDTSSSRFSKNVRLLKSYPNDLFSTGFPSIRYVASLAYTYYPYLKQKEEYLYSGTDDSLVTITQFVYDSTFKALKETTVYGSDNATQTIRLTYPFDHVRLNDTIPYKQLMDRHMPGLVTSKEILVNGLSKQKDLTVYATNISENSSLILPYKQLRVYPGMDTVQQAVIHQYDSIGNPLWITDAKDIHSSYVYGYGRTFPVASIINTEYPAVSTLLGGATSIAEFSRKINPSELEVHNFLDPVWNSSSLSSSIKATYISDPMIGLLKKTDDNGLRSFYEYDYLSRLHIVRDDDSNIVKKIGYKYFNQPDPFAGYYSAEITREFRKRNCPPMHYGSPVQVTLPAGYRFSYISQVDADTIALRYLLSIGQAYADSSDSSTCVLHTGTVFIKPTFGNIEVDEEGNEYADITVAFYADELMTIPLTLNDTTIYFTLQVTCPDASPYNIYDSAVVSGHSILLRNGALYTVMFQGEPECNMVWEEGVGWVEECLYPEPIPCQSEWLFSFNRSGAEEPEDPEEPLDSTVFKIGTVYAKVTIDNTETDMLGITYGDFHVNFYSDSSCTIPTTVSNLSIDYAFSDLCGQNDMPEGTIVANGSSYVFYTAIVSYLSSENEPCNVVLNLYEDI